MEEYKMRVGIGYDVHKFSDEKIEGNKIVLCGISIPFYKRIVAFSDGDVGFHAIVDAILGALALGDIGQHFPTGDDKWKDKDSEEFLRFANQQAKELGYVVNNLDVTFICQKPRISDYRDDMRARISQILEISKSQVSVKSTTTDGIGCLGREEGIAAQAIVSLVKNNK